MGRVEVGNHLVLISIPDIGTNTIKSPNGEKWTETDRNRQKQTETNGNRQRQTKTGRNGQKWTETDRN